MKKSRRKISTGKLQTAKRKALACCWCNKAGAPAGAQPHTVNQWPKARVVNAEADVLTRTMWGTLTAKNGKRTTASKQGRKISPPKPSEIFLP